jgi:hypothetical protein
MLLDCVFGELRGGVSHPEETIIEDAGEKD